MENKKIVAIGGGTGLSILLRGLKTFTGDITAIVNVVDDGGSSGILREDLSMLPPGDIRNCILGLANKESVLLDLFDYRFDEGRLKNQSLGNLMIAAMVGISDNFEGAISKISDIFAISGKVLPATSEDIHLVAELEDGTIVKGESRIPYQVLKKKTGIKRVYLSPEKALPLKESVDAIIDADIIFIGPGSLFTSLIPNLLVNGLIDSINYSKAKKIYVSNIMTQPGETDKYSIADHIKKIYEHTDEFKFDYVLANNKEVSKEIKSRYKKESSDMILVTKDDKKYFKNEDIKLIEGEFIEVKKGYVRHDIIKMIDCLDKNMKQN